MRPRGTPPTPTAASRLSDVVEIAGTSETSRSPRRIIEPLPNRFSMPDKAASIALPRSTLIRSSDAITYIAFFRSFSHDSAPGDASLPCFARSITHKTREWNSVSHLQHDYFLGGFPLPVPASARQPSLPSNLNLRLQKLLNRKAGPFLKLLPQRRHAGSCFVFRDPLHTPHREKQTAKTDERFGVHQRVYPIVERIQVKATQKYSRLVNLVEHAPTFFARRVEHNNHRHAGTNSGIGVERFFHAVLTPLPIRLRTD